MTPHGDIDLGQHWLWWWLVAWWHQAKAITWTNVDLSSVRSCGIHRRALSLENLKIPVSKTRLKIAFLESHSDLPEASELILSVEKWFDYGPHGPTEWAKVGQKCLCGDHLHRLLSMCRLAKPCLPMRPLPMKSCGRWTWTTFWWSSVGSLVTLVTTSTSSCGWYELPRESIPKISGYVELDYYSCQTVV